MMVFSIPDTIPYFYVPTGNMSHLMPVNQITGFTDPLNAVLVQSGVNFETRSLLEISNLSLADDNSMMTLQARPLEYYEGSVLKPFVGENAVLATDTIANISESGLYIELRTVVPENYNLCCKNNGCYIGCMKDRTDETSFYCEDRCGCPTKCPFL